MTTLALFNNKGGVGKTTLAYHLAIMMSRLGRRVLVVDLDPQANITSHFLDEDELEGVWAATQEAATVADAVKPIIDGLGDIAAVAPRAVGEDLWLVPGDLDLSRFEEHLASAWPSSFTGDNPAAVRTTTAFHRIVQAAAAQVDPDVVIVDVGPNLGAINRAALLIADHVLIPVGADLFSLQGLRNLGPTLRSWRRTWQDTVLPRVPAGISAPGGDMNPLGYVVMQPSMRLDRPVQAYGRWLDRLPAAYAEFVLALPYEAGINHEVATVRNYRSLMPLAHDARKPMFDLRAADGALGSTQRYVANCRAEFEVLTNDVLGRLEGRVATSSPTVPA
jgi:cellulose biosynthesis protein BcsQ